jgi:NADP-dependent 3-hydroxy acid dehydrogenase YdfG
MAALSPVHTYHSAPYQAIDPTNPDVSVQGRVVVITGGGSGIGQAVARAFASAGSTQIAILGRDQTALLATKVHIENDHAECSVLPVVADIVEIESVRAAFSTIVSEFGPIDVLINNAGFINNLSLWADADIGDWWRCYEVNVKGSMNVVLTFLSPGTFSTHASVINVSTGSAHLLIGGQGVTGFFA